MQVPIPNRELPESERRRDPPAEPPRRRRVGGRPRLPRRQVVMSVERSVFDLLRAGAERLGVSVSLLSGTAVAAGLADAERIIGAARREERR